MTPECFFKSIYLKSKSLEDETLEGLLLLLNLYFEKKSKSKQSLNELTFNNGKISFKKSNDLISKEVDDEILKNYLLTLCYSEGIGSEISPTKAFDYLKKCAEKGFDCAINDLGCAFAYGCGVGPSPEKAFFYFKQAAEQGNLCAVGNLVLCYSFGFGTNTSTVQAFKYKCILHEIDNSFDKDKLQLALKLDQFILLFAAPLEEVYQDLEYWEELSRKGSSIADYVLARFFLSESFQVDNSAKVQKEKGIKYLIKAADAGISLAQLWVAHSYEVGEGGLEISLEKAYYYTKLAADAGVLAGQIRLAVCLHKGKGTEQCYAEAFRYYKLAADRGDSLGQIQVGFFYNGNLAEESLVIEKSELEAFRYFKLAADQGDAIGQYMVGVAYEEGRGVYQSFEKAAFYYELAANQNDVDAQFALGVLYMQGLAVVESNELAFHWFKLAADQGHDSALHNTGIFYEKGLGVEKSYEQAAYYYGLAAGLKDKKAYLFQAQCLLNQNTPATDKKAVFILKEIISSGVYYSKDIRWLAYAHLSQCFYRGSGVEKSDTIAFYLYKKLEIE
jgi:uncharacterized protein